MNRKTLFIFLLVFGILVSSLIFRDGNLLLLSLPFLTYLGMGLYRSPRTMDLIGSRSLGNVSAIASENVDMQVVVVNRGNFQGNLLLHDPLLPSTRLVKGQNNRRVLAFPGQELSLNYTFQAGRGLYSWDFVRAVASDSFGLFEIEQDLPASAELLVKPTPLKLRHIPIRPRFTRHIPGPIPARLAGSGTDFFGVREYQPGDPLRLINWRMTARYPRKIFTTEFEQQEIAEIGLILDARTSTGNDVWDAALFDFSITATASLAEVFLREGNRVGLLVFGEEITPLFPGVGKRQLNRIYRCLANARVGREIPLEYLDYFPSRLLPSRSLIFMVSPLSLHDVSEYQRLAASGYQVILFSPDPIRFAARKFPLDQVNSLAVRLALVERHLQLDRLLRLGIQVIDWSVDRSLDETLHTVLNPLNNARFKSKAGL